MFFAKIGFQREHLEIDVQLELEKGCVTALMGASGSGKSTLFRLLSGLEQPETGEIKSDGECWFDALREYHRPVQHRKVGMVFQDYALFEHMNVFDNVAYGVLPEIRHEVVPDWLSRINLSHKSSSYPNELSGGEKQRVALARALANAPDILLLDEPFSALDHTLRHELRLELQALIYDTQLPVLIATHDLEEAKNLANFVYVMDEGQIIQSGQSKSIFSSPESLQAAKVLGWRNFLPIEHQANGIAKGKWGSLKVPSLESYHAYLALSQGAISLTPLDSEAGEGLTVEVLHSVDKDDHQLLDCRLADGVRLTFNLAGPETVVVGSHLVVFVDPSCVIPVSL